MASEIWIIIDLVLMTLAIAATVKVLNEPVNLPWLQILISALITMAVWWYAPLIPIVFAFVALILCWHLFFLRGREGWGRCIIAALIAFIIFIILEIIVGGIFEAIDEAVDSAWESATET
jgi:K+-sensing histidine kinase KdpD